MFDDDDGLIASEDWKTTKHTYSEEHVDSQRLAYQSDFSLFIGFFHGLSKMFKCAFITKCLFRICTLQCFIPVFVVVFLVRVKCID